MHNAEVGFFGGWRHLERRGKGLQHGSTLCCFASGPSFFFCHLLAQYIGLSSTVQMIETIVWQSQGS